MDAHQLINQTSGDTEYYTPPEIIEAARSVMGKIDIDPASSAKANERVLARLYYNQTEDGLLFPWHGTVWLNWPFGRIQNPKWCAKLISEYEIRNTVQACTITFAATSEAWFQPLMQYPQCYLTPRTNYYLADGTKKKGVTKGSVVTYFGQQLDLFAAKFERFGTIKIRYE